MPHCLLCRGKGEDKEAIFESWNKLLNSFDTSISIQISFINRQLDPKQLEKQIALHAGADGLDALREEYMQILRDRLQTGNNGLMRRKFITFGLQSDSREAAERKPERVEAELLNSLRQMGAIAERRNGYQRMELLHDLYNIGTDKRLNFSRNKKAAPYGATFQNKSLWVPVRVRYRKSMLSSISYTSNQSGAMWHSQQLAWLPDSLWLW